jgi:hypothetical protein
MPTSLNLSTKRPGDSTTAWAISTEELFKRKTTLTAKRGAMTGIHAGICNEISLPIALGSRFPDIEVGLPGDRRPISRRAAAGVVSAESQTMGNCRSKFPFRVITTASIVLGPEGMSKIPRCEEVQ